MGSVRGRSPLARVAARLRRGGKEIPPAPGSHSDEEWVDALAEFVDVLTRPMTAEDIARAESYGCMMPPVTSGMVLERDPPPIVPIPTDQAPTSIAQPPARYPRHGFGQEWPR